MKQFLTFNALVLRTFLLLGLGTSASFANTFTVGAPGDSGNCIPFGCDTTPYNDEYQQVYNSGQFTEPMTITGLDFYNVVFSTAAAIDSGTWTISLSTTSADWNSLDATLHNNIGVDNTVVFSGDLAQLRTSGETLTIPFNVSNFTYTPVSGENLLMDVVTTGITTTGVGDISFDVNSANTFMGVGYGSSVGGGTVSGYGLVTGFDTSAQPVPESNTFAPLGGLLLVLAGSLRRKGAK